MNTTRQGDITGFDDAEVVDEKQEEDYDLVCVNYFIDNNNNIRGKKESRQKKKYVL